MKAERKALQLVALLILILLTGAFGYHVIEGWPYFDSLYMTVITLATVGYGETHPLSTPGRVFTMFLILGGMGIILYGVTEVTAFVVEGEMTGFLRRRKMGKAIKRLSNHYIICGIGNNGHYVMEELIKTRRKVVVVEKDREKVLELLEKGILAVEGDAADDSVLKAAGIDTAAGLVASLPEDKDNLFVVITARGLNSKVRIVAKIDDITVRDKLLRSGADSAVSASYIGGLRMASELVRPETVTFLDSMLRDKSALRVQDVKVGSDSRYSGKTLGECEGIPDSGVVLVSLKQGDSFKFNPPPDTVLNGGDTLVVIGDPDQVAHLSAKLR